MSSDELREQLHLSRQALNNYLKLGILNPVPGTEDRGSPMYYTDEVAVIREALISCQNSITKLNKIRNKVYQEVIKANTALTVLQLDAATKDGATRSIIDSIDLFINRAVPDLNRCKVPLYWLRWSDRRDIEDYIENMTDMASGRTPQDFCNELYEEVGRLDKTIASRDDLVETIYSLSKENQELKEQVKYHKQQLAWLEDVKVDQEQSPSSPRFKVVTDKQDAGLRLRIKDCGFSIRVINSFRLALDSSLDNLTLAHVVALKAADLKNLRNFGKNSLLEIEDKLAQYDLTLGMDVMEIEGRYCCE